jgi:hypothetical protein
MDGNAIEVLDAFSLKEKWVGVQVALLPSGETNSSTVKQE